MNVIEEEKYPNENGQENNQKISQFVDQYQQLSENYKHLLNNKYSTINYPFGLPITPGKSLLTVRNCDVKPLNVYLSKTNKLSKNLGKIDSKLFLVDENLQVQPKTTKNINGQGLKAYTKEHRDIHKFDRSQRQFKIKSKMGEMSADTSLSPMNYPTADDSGGQRTTGVDWKANMEM